MPHAIKAGRLRTAMATFFSDAGIFQPHLEVDRIVCHVLGIARPALHAYPDRTIYGDDFARAMELLVRRAAGEPLAHLLGSALFCGLEFEVNRHTLIPRTETEILVSHVDDWIKQVGTTGLFADWCTGSGCIATALLVRNPGWHAVAVDISEDALFVAQRNARRHGVVDRIRFLSGASPEAVADFISPQSLDVVVANPPYITSEEIAQLETQVRDYEPRIALDGGTDGLDVYRLLLAGLPALVRPGGRFFVETAGEAQVCEIAAVAGAFVCCGSLPDHLGRERFAHFALKAV